MDHSDFDDDSIHAAVSDGVDSTDGGSVSRKLDHEDIVTDTEDGEFSVPKDSSAIATTATLTPPWPPIGFYSPELLLAQKKSLFSLQRSLVLCHEMEAFAKHTVTKLDEGANTFQLMEDQQTEMEKDLLETADNFQEMAKCCGLCPWRTKQRPPIEDAPDAPLSLPLMPSRSINQPGHAENSQVASLVIIPHDRVELQMEYEIELVEGFIDQLEEMSTSIHAKLTAETESLEAVTDKLDKNMIRVVMARQKAQALLKSV